MPRRDRGSSHLVLTRPEPTTHPSIGMATRFEQLCHAYDAGTLHVPFRMLSNHVHPTATGAEAYVDSDARALRNHGSADRSDLVLVAICVIMAARAIGSLIESRPLTGSIQLAQDRLGIEGRPNRRHWAGSASRSSWWMVAVSWPASHWARRRWR
jgi:hypothetical protein